MAEPIPCFAEYGYLGGLRIKILMVKKKKKKECLRTLDLHNLQVIKQEPKAIRYFGMDTFTRVYSRKKLCCLKYIA